MRPTTESEARDHPGPKHRSFWGLPWVMVTLGLAIAAVLLLRGSYILGLLIAALAVVRVVYLVGISRRRRVFRDSLGAGPVQGVLRELAPYEFVLASGMLGLDPAEARRAFEKGSSLAELATGAGIPVEQMVGAIVEDASAKLDGEVSCRRMTQSQASQVKVRLPIWANRLVHFHKGDFQGTRGWA